MAAKTLTLTQRISDIRKNISKAKKEVDQQKVVRLMNLELDLKISYAKEHGYAKFYHDYTHGK